MRPTQDDWIRLVEGRCTESERSRLEAILETESDDLRALVADYRLLIDAMGTDRLLDPPESSVHSVLRAIRPEASPELPGWAAGLREALARLVFDSFGEPAFAGARSAGVARRLRFESDGVELDVLIEQEGDRRRLSGQVLELGPDPEPRADAPYVVLTALGPEREGETDAHGELGCELAGGGEIEIRLAVSGRLLVFRIPEPSPDAPTG